MPRQSTTASFAKSMGKELAAAHKKAAEAETTYSQFGDLPAGIRNGVAKLTNCEIKKHEDGQKNAGKWYFSAQAVVVAPQMHGDENVEGLRTRIYEPLYDTPTRTRPDVPAHWEWVLNTLRMLGLKTSGKTIDGVEKSLPLLVKSGPFVKFRTWASEPRTPGEEPFVNHDWQGTTEWEESDPADRVNETEDTDESDFDPDEIDPPKLKKKRPPKSKKSPPTEDDDEPEEEEEEPKDKLAALAEKADNDDKAAARKLTSLGKTAGLDEEEMKDADSWEDVAQMIRDAQEEDEEDEEEEDEIEEPEEDEEEDEDDEEEEEDDEEFIPEKGDGFNFKPVNPKTGKKARKAIEGEVTFVSKKNKTVNLKDDDDKVYKGVPWDDLEDV